jgi:hypothetical protein
MSLIAFITDGPEVRKILTHIGTEPEAPALLQNILRRRAARRCGRTVMRRNPRLLASEN